MGASTLCYARGACFCSGVGDERKGAMPTYSQIDFLRLDLHRQELAAKSVPYVSFILTHVALVLFIVSAFFVDRLVGSPSSATPIRILLVVMGVLLIATEWVYAIMTSRRWKKDVIVLLQLEAVQRQREAEEKMRRQEEIIANEQLRNRVLQADNQRLRNQYQGFEQEAFAPVRSVRPPNPPAQPELGREHGLYPSPRSVRPMNPPLPAFPELGREQGSYPPARSARPMNPPPSARPDSTRLPAFPPYPLRENFGNAAGGSSFENKSPR